MSQQDTPSYARDSHPAKDGQGAATGAATGATTGTATRASAAGAGLGANSLMALGSAAVIGVYAAGYFKTKAAADRFAADSDVRRPPPGGQATAVERTVERVTSPAADPRGTRLRAGATAALPPLPALEKLPGDVSARPASSPSASEQAAVQATVANSIPSAASAASEDSATPTVAHTTPTAASTAASTAPLVAAPVPAQPAPAPAPAQAVAPQTAPQTAPVAAKHVEPEPPAAPNAARWKDGTYYGWGTSRHGDIQAAVVIQGGRIANALIAQCLTRYSCSWIAALPPQVVGRQSAEVDYVSGATQSVNAFYYAILEALSHAK